MEQVYQMPTYTPQIVAMPPNPPPLPPPPPPPPPTPPEVPE